MKHYTFENAAVRLAGATAAREFFQPILTEQDREHLLVALCDEEVRLMRLLCIRGTDAYVQFSLADVLRPIIISECAAIILAHNHPSGDTRPSEEDLAITKRLALAAEAMDITVLDHLIFNGGPAFSFRERGLL